MPRKPRVEIEDGMLSKFMRQINMNYAIYFNKKNKRSSHLWQGRFKSWYVTDEAYLYTLNSQHMMAKLNISNLLLVDLLGEVN